MKKKHDYDVTIETAMGEWWEECKSELHDMNRKSLIRELEDNRIAIPNEAEILWLRLMVARERQVKFYHERELDPPKVIEDEIKKLWMWNGKCPTWMKNIFRKR